MFVKQCKLLLRGQVDFFTTAKRKYSPFFICFSQPSDLFHLSIIIPKKTVKLATQRNKVKRKYYAACADILPQLKTQRKNIMLHILKKGVELSQKEIQVKLLQECFR